MTKVKKEVVNLQVDRQTTLTKKPPVTNEVFVSPQMVVCIHKLQITLTSFLKIQTG